MKIESPVFNHQESIPVKYSESGKNINPPLKITDVPSSAKSLVLIIDDPDAPLGTWIHWLLWNIDPNIKEIDEDRVPEGAVAGMTNFNKTSYGGPCPPSGTHRYFFKLLALNTELDHLLPGDSIEKLQKATEGHVIERAELVGLFRSQ